MAVMNVRNGEIYLEDFKEIENTAYFVFRRRGLEISSTKPDTILPIEIYEVVEEDHEKKIKNSQLAEKLKELGYGNTDIFAKIDTGYIVESKKGL